MASDSFYFHKVSEETLSEIIRLRAAYISLADLIESMCPESCSRSLALTELEYSQMRAIQSLAIAYGEKQVP